MILEPDEGRVTLILRAVVPLGLGPDHDYTVVRALEPWEAAPELAAIELSGESPRAHAGGSA